jgi:hypothetical protein
MRGHNLLLCLRIWRFWRFSLKKLADMTAYLLADHLLNFVAPAALIALLLVLFSRLFSGFFRSKQSFTQVLWAQTAINFVVGVGVLSASLVLQGRDGKMLTYVVLVLAIACSQWWQLGGWKR